MQSTQSLPSILRSIRKGAQMHIKSAAGYALLEVLIAIVILAVAMISFVRLQAATMHAARQAIVLELVQQLAVELADWIRASRPATTLLAVFNEHGTPAVASCYQQSCTPQQLARFDWGEWRQRVLHVAPAARISVCRSDHAPLSDWGCAADDALNAPLIIRVGWPLPKQPVNFLPALAITVGSVSP